MIAVKIQRHELAALTELHTACLQRARSHERAERRLRFDEPSRAELCGDQARQARQEASALAKLLAMQGVVTADSEDRLQLWSDGGPDNPGDMP